MISFDLDMTLLDHRTDQITPSALEAIEKLRPKHRIVLATGRDMDNYYSTSYRDIVRPDAIVHMNGTKITVGDKLLFEHIFDPELLRRVLSFCDEKGFGIGMTVGDEDYYIHPEIIAANDIRFWGSCGRQFQDPWKMLTMPVRTLAVEKGNSKADGLRRLAVYFGEKEDLSDTVAFGDSMNDIEVVQEAGIGVAMGNAVDALKKVADYVTAPIGEDGIYKACEHLHLF